MTWYGVFVVLFISVCFTTNIKAQETIIASSAPGNCAGKGNGYIAFYRCMLQCFQNDLGYDGLVESDFCSGDVQVTIIQGDGTDAYTIDDLKDALKCVTGRCRSVIPPSVCQDSTPQIINLPDDIKKEVLSGIESSKYRNSSGSQSEKKRGSSGLKSGQLVDNSGLQDQLDASRQLSKLVDGSRKQTSQQGFSGLLSKVLKASGLQPGQLADVPGLQSGQLDISGQPGQLVIPGQPGQLVVPGQPGQLVVPGQPGQLVVPGQPGQLVVPGQPGQLVVPGQPGQLVDLGQPGQSIVPGQPGQLVLSGQPGQADGSGKQKSQIDVSGLLSKVLKSSGIQPGQSDVSDLLLRLIDRSGVKTGKLDALRLQPGQGVEVSGIQPGQSAAVSGPQSGISASVSGPESESLAFAFAPGGIIDDCDDSQDDVSSNNPTADSSNTPTSSVTSTNSISGATLASSTTAITSDSFTTPATTAGTTPATTASGASDSSSADYTSDISAEDCEEYDGSLSNLNENSNSFSRNGNSFAVAVASASENGDSIGSFSEYYDYTNDNCTYFYDDYNGTFSNCSFFNGSFSNSSYYNSSDYDYDYASNSSNYNSSSAFAEVQITNQNSGIQQSVSVGNGPNQGQIANAAVVNQNPTIQQYQMTDQNIGVAPSGTSQDQGLFVNIPTQNEGPTIQQFQNNNNGFQDLNSQNLGQFGNAPVVGQSLNQGQLQSTFVQIPGSQIPTVQQYQSNNNGGGGVAIGSGQNPGQFINSFLKIQGFDQNPAVTQYGSGFAANQQYPVQIAGNGGSGPTQGLSPNIPAQTQTIAGNFGSLPQFNSAQNNANIQQFNIGSINPASALNTATSDTGFGIGSSDQTQGLALNYPAQGQNNFGNVPQFNFAPNSGNVQQFNGGVSNLASAVANTAVGIGSSSQTLGGLTSNVPAGTNFGTGQILNFQMNSGNVPPYNGVGNNPGVISAVDGSGDPSQIQSSPINVPVQGPASPGSNFGSGSSFNSFQYNGNGGGIGQNSNGVAVSSFASNNAPSGIFNSPGDSVNSQPLGGGIPFSQGSTSTFGSAVNAQAQASAW